MYTVKFLQMEEAYFNFLSKSHLDQNPDPMLFNFIPALY